jgi:peptide/nickel transport system permease protein
MIHFVARRLLQAIPMILGVTTILFFTMQAIPGDPAAVFINPDLPPDNIEQIRRNLGLDQPVIVQYFKWLKNAVVLDFGMSIFHQQPVRDKILEALPYTLVLSLTSIFFIFTIGMTIGLIGAIRQYSLLDNTLTVLSLFLYSMPSFWLGLMLILTIGNLPTPFENPLTGDTLRLPISGVEHVQAYAFPPGARLVDRLLHLVLPVIALGVALSASIARYTRGSYLEVIRQDFIRTARAKGLSEWRVVLVHGLRNAIIPIITIFGLSLPFLFSGAVLVEQIFAWPGMGRLIVSAVFQRDFPLVLGTTFFITLFVILGNLIADILYAVVDPRIRYD